MIKAGIDQDAIAAMFSGATARQGEALRRQLANTLGETLARMPGLANASFGENVGRPVISTTTKPGRSR